MTHLNAKFGMGRFDIIPLVHRPVERPTHLRQYSGNSTLLARAGLVYRHVQRLGEHLGNRAL